MNIFYLIYLQSVFPTEAVLSFLPAWKGFPYMHMVKENIKVAYAQNVQLMSQQT